MWEDFSNFLTLISSMKVLVTCIFNMPRPTIILFLWVDNMKDKGYTFHYDKTHTTYFMKARARRPLSTMTLNVFCKWQNDMLNQLVPNKENVQYESTRW